MSFTKASKTSEANTVSWAEFRSFWSTQSLTGQCACTNMKHMHTFGKYKKVNAEVVNEGNSTECISEVMCLYMCLTREETASKCSDIFVFENKLDKPQSEKNTIIRVFFFFLKPKKNF